MVSKLKNLFLIIVIILFSVIYVKADSNNSDLTIQNIEIIDKADTMDSSVELNPISNISTNSSFFEEGDYVKYKITIKNNSNNKYQIKELLDNNDQTYINNTYEYSKKEINQNEEYSFNMITSYNNLISTKKEIINTPLIISLKYSNQSSNPNTIDTIYIYHLIFLISLLLFTFFMKMSKKQRATLIIGLCILNIPFLVKASGNVFNLELYRDIHIYKDTAIFVTGKEFNKKIKSLASNNQNITYNSEDNLISRIVVASEKNTELTENNIISSEKTNLPIYAWYEERTIYLWSEDNNPELNPNSSCMFQKLNNVKNISLNDFDSSNIKDSSYMFLDDKSIETIRIENLETKKVTNMESMFEGCEKIKNIDCTSFNTEKVNNMKDMFK
ncbi:MAG: BspA family leucine-rich repeat surface protein, partial [Bacilli bacterium]|nr:BspA family leucine-rich repeat surface protein [Bacilli bacterium]